MAKCVQELKVCQTANERQDYAFNLTREFSRLWQKDHPFGASACVRPSEVPTGLQYRSSGGQSAAEEPEWPTTIGGTVIDGDITWTAESITSDSLAERIATVDWATHAPAGIVLSDQVETDSPGLQEVRIFASGGVERTTYTCPAIIKTVSGKEFEVRLKLTIDP